jgi:hypothetical protein
MSIAVQYSPCREAIPVLLLGYRRPKHLMSAIKRLQNVKPEQLFVAIDGPKSAEERNVVKECQETIKAVTWPCTVHTLFRVDNLGLKMALESALDWFFENVTFGIIIEDDVEVEASFFDLAFWADEHFRSESRIMHVNACNYSGDSNQTLQRAPSCVLSRYVGCWGWATWRRSWPLVSERALLEQLSIAELWRSLNGSGRKGRCRLMLLAALLLCRQRKLSSWAYSWSLHVWMSQGLSIIPKSNLVTNTGCGEGGTHTSKEHRFSALKTGTWSPPHDGLVGPLDEKIERQLFRFGYDADNMLKLVRMLASLCFPAMIFKIIRRTFR